MVRGPAKAAGGGVALADGRQAGVDCGKTREGDMSCSISISVQELGPPRVAFATDVKTELATQAFPRKFPVCIQ